ncbi:ZIP family metal transporter [Candidatus Bathyarchaeota archaeon]|nr:MAG: ZIP family metal transporter [Candidatus Bathyarchaeota archaeon]
MSVMPLILAATVVVSLFSLSGIFALSLNEKHLHRVLFVIIGFSAGSILGAVFFDLLPEAIELVESDVVFVYVALGFVLFFFLERFIYWYHGHGHREDIEHLPARPGKAGTREFAYLNLIGDGIHNFIDGIVIAVSFLVDPAVGAAATVAVIFHELPQEMGDYGILLYGGFSRRSALVLNFAVALTVVFGGATALFVSNWIEELSGLLIALAAGGFTYLGASELIPELHEEKTLGRSVVQFIAFLLGLSLIWSLGIIFPE